MNDTTIATIRTVTPAAWAALILDLVKRVTGADLNLADLATLAGIYLPLLAVVYRIGRLAAAKYPALAWVIFGHASSPTYR